MINDPRFETQPTVTICAWCEHAINQNCERLSTEALSVEFLKTEHVSHGICQTCAGTVFADEGKTNDNHPR